MALKPHRFDGPVTIAGGGPVNAATLAEARCLAPRIVAADGGADRIAALGARPDLIVGDLDSLSDPSVWRDRGVPVRHVAEQDTTDFEKCLLHTEAPLYLGIGVTGGRLDHTLAVLHAMLRQRDKPTLLLGAHEVLTLVPADAPLRLQVSPGSTVSLFPLSETTGLASEGLRWPIDGLTFAAGQLIGTSNIADRAEIALRLDRPGMILSVERAALPALATAIAPTAGTLPRQG